MTAIGSTLKDARAKQSLTLEDVHAKTKIHPRVLQLLEDEKFEKLPSPLFAKSFLRSYADFLNVDSEELLKAYEDVKKPKEPEQALFIRTAEEREGWKKFDQKLLAIPVALVALVFAGYVLFIAVKTVAEALPKAGSSLTTKWAEGKKQKAAKKEAAKKEKEKKVTEKAAAKTKASKDWLRSVEQGNFPDIEKTTPLALKIKAVDNVWLRVTADGKTVFQSILKRGVSEEWSAKNAVEIWTGNSSNMVLTLNGYNLGSPGKGVVRKLSVSHKGVKISS